MFNSFVRAGSGLNPFGKAVEATNDIVVSAGGIDEATLNNEGEPQQAPPERERRQVREMRPDKRDLEAGEIYYGAVKKMGYRNLRPGDADVRIGGEMPDRDSQPVQGQFR